MGSFRDKIQPFFLGLSIGLLIACLFFIFKLDSYLHKIDTGLLSKTQIITEQILPKNDEKSDKKEQKTEKKPHFEQKNIQKPVISLNNVNDSAYLESESYHVLKEELVSVKNIYVKTLIPSEKTSAKDSLIAAMAGVTQPADNEFFMIEFWKTPLNSKGYKMSRNRLLIYGYPQNEDIALVKTTEGYYLRNNSVVYKVNYSPEFKPMERATNAEAQVAFR